MAQRYALVATDEDGTITPKDKRLLGGLVGACVYELEAAGVVEGNAQHIWAAKPLPPELAYLAPLYDVIASRGKIPAAQLLAWLVTGPDAQAHINVLLVALLAPLVSEGYVEERSEGIFEKRVQYRPTLRGVNAVLFEVVPQIQGESELTPDNARLAVIARAGHALRHRYDRRTRKELRAAMDNLPLEALTPAAQEAVLTLRANPLINAVMNPSVSS
jgi:hypothetical protein